MDGAYVHINIPNIITVSIMAALGVLLVSALSSLIRQYAGPAGA